MQNLVLLLSSLLLTGTNLILTQCGHGFHFHLFVKQAGETGERPVLKLAQADILSNFSLVQNTSIWHSTFVGEYPHIFSSRISGRICQL